jgi:hypothetical protein
MLDALRAQNTRVRPADMVHANRMISRYRAENLEEIYNAGKCHCASSFIKPISECLASYLLDNSLMNIERELYSIVSTHGDADVYKFLKCYGAEYDIAPQLVASWDKTMYSMNMGYKITPLLNITTIRKLAIVLLLLNNEFCNFDMVIDDEINYNLLHEDIPNAKLFDIDIIINAIKDNKLTSTKLQALINTIPEEKNPYFNIYPEVFVK